MALVLYQGPQTNGTEENKSDEHPSRSKFVGLANQGATCYLNGLLQTLYMTPEFRKAIFTWHYDSAKDGLEDHCIPLQLQKLFGLLQLSSCQSVDTVGLTKSFGWEDYEVFQQQDVQELTRVLFNALEESFRGTKVETVIDDLYAGQLIDYLRCFTVDYQSERVDKFLDFSVAIVPFENNQEPMHSLHECIEFFLRPELLNGDNQYYVEQFQQKVDAIKGLKFGKLPQIMSVQLKRFVYDFSGAYVTQKKLNNKVKFPMVLDMNKYVAKKKQRKAPNTITDSSSDAPSEEETMEITNEEFENFVKEQMEKLLKAQQAQSQMHDISETTTQDGYSIPNSHSSFSSINTIPTSSSTKNPFLVSHPSESGVATIDDIIDDDRMPTYSGSQSGPAAAATILNPVLFGNLEDDPDVPALIDLSAPMTSTMHTAEEVGILHSADENVRYDSLSQEAIQEMIEHHGEWIYELYAVLIHSGAISGGHYYAYIKDFESNQWYNFNDSTVTLIDEQTVQDAWGGNTIINKYPSYSNYASSYTTSSYLSSANAYMLMYRKVVINERITIPNEMIPSYIHDMVIEQEAMRIKKLREEEELRNRLNVKIFYEGKEYSIASNRASTYKELLQKLWNELPVLRKAIPIDEETANNADHIPYEYFRLRDYNQYTKLATVSYEYPDEGEKLLGLELFFNDYKNYALEIRSKGDDWEAYYPDGLSILIEEYDPLTNGFKEHSRTMRLPQYCTLGELKNRLLKYVSYPIEYIRVMKISMIGLHDGRLEVLMDDTRRMKEDYGIYDCWKVYIEDARYTEELNDPYFHALPEGYHPPVIYDMHTKCFDTYINVRNRFELRFNIPPGEEYNQLVIADARWKVGQLRDVIALRLTIPVEKCRLFRQTIRGVELKDSDLTLSQSGIYNGSIVGVMVGKATPSGYYQVAISQYTAIDHIPGVMFLPTSFPAVEITEKEDGKSLSALSTAFAAAKYEDEDELYTTTTKVSSSTTTTGTAGTGTWQTYIDEVAEEQRRNDPPYPHHHSVSDVHTMTLAEYTTLYPDIPDTSAAFAASSSSSAAAAYRVTQNCSPVYSDNGAVCGDEDDNLMMDQEEDAYDVYEHEIAAVEDMGSSHSHNSHKDSVEPADSSIPMTGPEDDALTAELIAKLIEEDCREYDHFQTGYIPLTSSTDTITTTATTAATTTNAVSTHTPIHLMGPAITATGIVYGKQDKEMDTAEVEEVIEEVLEDVEDVVVDSTDIITEQDIVMLARSTSSTNHPPDHDQDNSDSDPKTTSLYCHITPAPPTISPTNSSSVSISPTNHAITTTTSSSSSSSSSKEAETNHSQQQQSQHIDVEEEDYLYDTMIEESSPMMIERRDGLMISDDTDSTRSSPIDGCAAIVPITSSEDVSNLPTASVNLCMTVNTTQHTTPSTTNLEELPALEMVSVTSSFSAMDVLTNENVDTNNTTTSSSSSSMIEPSDFGERKVKNSVELHQYQALEELDNIYVQMQTSVEELRFQITKALIEKEKIPSDTSPYRIRLRERYGNNPGKILRSGNIRKVINGIEIEDETNRKSLSDLRIYLTDQKQFAIELLSEEEFLPEEDTGDVIVLVQRWNRSTWSLGMRIEVLFPGNMMVCDIAKGLSILFDIPVSSMRVLIIPRETQFPLYELSHASPSSYYGRQWFDPTEETKLLRYMSHAMRLSDGDLVVVQDVKEPLMTLTAADQRSMELTEQASSLAGFFPSTTSGTSTYYPHYTYTNSSSNSTTRSSQQGIKIKTHKDRKEEEEKKAAAAAAAAEAAPTTQATVDGGSESSTTVTVSSVPKSKEEYISREMQHGGSVSVDVGTSMGDALLSKDETDFLKQGGYETLSDLV